MKLKRNRKSKKYRGFQTAKRGRASRTRASGSQGGVGMAGTGKRGDQKKTLVIKLTGGNNYFRKDKALRKPIIKKLKSINLRDVNLKKENKDNIIDLTGYKILGEGELTSKVKIKASAASASALSAIEMSGSEIILPKKNKEQEKASSKN
jgi:large subunit ribosomal protein L15